MKVSKKVANLPSKSESGRQESQQIRTMEVVAKMVANLPSKCEFVNREPR